MGEIELSIFNLAPMAMWIQDFSAVKKIFQQWTDEGVEDLEQYLLEDPERLQPCLMVINTIQVNQSTLELYEAADLNEILASFARLHHERISIEKVKFFVALWNKQAQCVCPSINFTCHGKQIDILLKASVMPGYEDSWERLLLTTENVSDYQNARRFAESLFIHSPTALWVKDYSGIKQLFTELKNQGIQDLEQYIQQHPDFLLLCFQNIRSIDVNQALLNLFNAASKQHFYQNVRTLLNENGKQHFQNELLYLWQEHYHLERDCEYKTLDAKTIHLREQLMIFPNAHQTWDTVQIAYTDFTARKQLEEYLEFMSHRDELTQLYNRNFFNAEVKRLQHETVYPTACIYLDINGLKTINDLG
ncbi:GGDEF domain-containing protein, partial [Acinetobacter sp. CFCC 10889]|uniref:GGDEF domain-containing protein n=1 Tax=Acinetobacter sp. CFCC 10889 TaxID=1775557 RepID=UPI000DD0D5CC